MEHQGKHIKKWWAAIPNSVLLQLLQELVQARGAGEKWTEAMAHISLKLDFDAQEHVTLRGYRTQWGWGAERVKKFIKNSGLELVKVDPENKKSLSVLCRNSNGTQTELNQTSNGTKKIIDFEDLESETDHKQTANRPQTDHKPAPPVYKHKQEGDLKQLASLLQNLDLSSQQYVENELRRKNPTNPLAYAQAVIRRLDNERTERSASYENYSGNGNAGCRQELPPAHRAALEYLSSL